MDKDEILRKAQSRQGLDEREAQVAQKGSEVAMWVGLAVTVLLMVLKMAFENPLQDIYCIFCTMPGVLHLYKWAKLRARHHLVWGILWLTVAVILFCCYLTVLL